MLLTSLVKDLLQQIAVADCQIGGQYIVALRNELDIDQKRVVLRRHEIRLSVCLVVLLGFCRRRLSLSHGIEYLPVRRAGWQTLG